MLEIETKYFEACLSDFVKTDLGKFVLIKDQQVHGTFEAISDALNAGYEKFKDQPFFVRQIQQMQQPLNFVNNHLFA